MIEVKLFSKRDCLVRMHNEILDQCVGNELEIALFDEDLKFIEKPEMDEETKTNVENIKKMKAKMEATVIKQTRALKMLEDQIAQIDKDAEKATKKGK